MSALAKTPMVAPSVATGPQFDNRRVAAALIDLLIPLAMASAAYAAGLSFTRGVTLVVAGWTLYYFFALESGDGQTLGKRIMKLRVVSADGSPATMQQIAKRTVVRIVDGNVVGLIVMLATGDRRMRLGDIVAGTVVTDAEAAPAASAVVAEPPAEKVPFHKRPISLPSLRKKQDLSPQAQAAQVPAVPAPFAPPEPSPGAEKLPFHKRPISMPSFGRRAKAAAPAGMSQTAGPGPADAPPQAVSPQPTFEAPVRAEEPVYYEPPPSETGQADRLSDALRASEPVDEEPVVEFDTPEPEVQFADEYEPVVELDRDEPDPLADLGGREPVVELDEPQPQPEPLSELEPWAEPRVHAHEPSVEPEAHEPGDADSDPEMTIKPIETVSAIDLVMQDAEQRRAHGD